MVLQEIFQIRRQQSIAANNTVQQAAESKRLLSEWRERDICATDRKAVITGRNEKQASGAWNNVRRRVGRTGHQIAATTTESILLRPLGVVFEGRRNIASQRDRVTGLHWLASEHVLHVRDGASGVGHKRAAGQDRKALLGGVEHALYVRQDTSNIGGDKRVLRISLA